MIVLKTIGAAVMITGAIGLGAVGVGSGVASAAPGAPGAPWQQDDGGWGRGHGGGCAGVATMDQVGVGAGPASPRLSSRFALKPPEGRFILSGRRQSNPRS